MVLRCSTGLLKDLNLLVGPLRDINYFITSHVVPFSDMCHETKRISVTEREWGGDGLALMAQDI